MNLIPRVWVHTARVFDNDDNFVAEVITAGNEPATSDNLRISHDMLHSAAVILTELPDGTVRVLKNRWGALGDLKKSDRRPSKKDSVKNAHQVQHGAKFEDIRDTAGFTVLDAEGDKWRWNDSEQQFEFACEDENYTEWRISYSPVSSINSVGPFEVVAE